jgi:hypothetical protein
MVSGTAPHLVLSDTVGRLNWSGSVVVLCKTVTLRKRARVPGVVASKIMESEPDQGAYLALTLMTYSALEDSSVTSIRQSQPGCNFPSRLWRI